MWISNNFIGKMNEKSRKMFVASNMTGDNIAKLLREKDKIIKLQAKRILTLEKQSEILRNERDSWKTKCGLLQFKVSNDHGRKLIAR